MVENPANVVDDPAEAQTGLRFALWEAGKRLWEAWKRLMPADPLGAAPTIGVGLLVLFLFFGVFGSWAAFAPLDSAAVASGIVSVDTNRKTVQHLEGGIVGAILVRDGDVVEAGQVLIRLDETQARASYDLLYGRWTSAKALEARLLAERDSKDGITFPAELLDRGQDAEVAELISGQINIFEARISALAGQIAILEQRVAQYAEEIKGLEGEIASQDTQLGLIKQEIDDVTTLYEKGLALKPRLLALQRNFAEIEGERNKNRAQIARARQSIGETRLQMNDLKATQTNEVVQELRDVQTELFDLSERLSAARDVLSRTEIRAPLAGTIVGLKMHTTGGVIVPREPLLNIVPSGDSLLIEARVDPADIDIVKVGLPAQVRITAFSQRDTPPIDGKVIAVSADRLTDERTGQDYYLARVELTGDLQKALKGAPLHPGMQAEVMIVTGARTALDYLFKPITQSMNRALREE